MAEPIIYKTPLEFKPRALHTSDFEGLSPEDWQIWAAPFTESLHQKTAVFFKDPSQEREHHLSLGAQFFQSTPVFWGVANSLPWKDQAMTCPRNKYHFKAVIS